MTIILDENLPRGLLHVLAPHPVTTVQQAGYTGVRNGESPALLEGSCDVFLTGDKNLRYQQNLTGRRLAIVGLPTNRWPALRLLCPQIIQALDGATLSMSRASQIILLAAVLLVCGCRPPSASGTSDPKASATAPTTVELAEFARQSHLSLPSSARFVRYYGESGLDSAVWLQFRLPAAELPPFLAASSIPAEPVRPGSSGAESPLDEFRAWLPTVPRHFQYADTAIAPGRYVKCIFDLDDPQTTVVYLMWFTT